jgi:hypothetical protein
MTQLLALHITCEEEHLDAVLDELVAGFDYSADHIRQHDGFTSILVEPDQLLKEVFANGMAYSRLEAKGIIYPFCYTVHDPDATDEEILATLESQESAATTGLM